MWHKFKKKRRARLSQSDSLIEGREVWREVKRGASGEKRASGIRNKGAVTYQAARGRRNPWCHPWQIWEWIRAVGWSGAPWHRTDRTLPWRCCGPSISHASSTWPSGSGTRPAESQSPNLLSNITPTGLAETSGISQSSSLAGDMLQCGQAVPPPGGNKYYIAHSPTPTINSPLSTVFQVIKFLLL